MPVSAVAGACVPAPCAPPAFLADKENVFDASAGVPFTAAARKSSALIRPRDFDPVSQLAKVNAKLQALRQQNDEMRQELQTYKATGPTAARIANLQAELKVAKRAQLAAQNHLDRERAARQSLQSDFKAIREALSDAEATVVTRNSQMSVLGAKVETMESERDVLGRECITSQDRLAVLEVDAKQATSMAESAMKRWAEDGSAGGRRQGEENASGKAGRGQQACADFDGDGELDECEAEAERNAELLDIESHFARLLASTRPWSLQHGVVVKQCRSFAEDVEDLWSRRNDLFLETLDAEEAVRSSSSHSACSEAQQPMAISDMSRCLGLVESERCKFQVRAEAAEVKAAATTLFCQCARLRCECMHEWFQWMVYVLDGTGVRGLTDSMSKVQLRATNLKRDNDRLQTEVTELDEENRQWAERADKDVAEEETARAQLSEAQDKCENLSGEVVQWQTEHSYVALFNALLSVFSVSHRILFTTCLQWGFQGLKTAWLCTSCEQSLKHDLIAANAKYAKLENSTKLELNEFEELCLQQFETEIAQVKDAEESRRIDLVEERDGLRSELNSLQSKLARAVAEKATLESVSKEKARETRSGVLRAVSWAFASLHAKHVARSFQRLRTCTSSKVV